IGVTKDSDCKVVQGKILINVKAGKKYVCKLINEDIPGTITVYKKVINDDGGSKKARDFKIGIDGDWHVEQGKPKKLSAGQHVIWEKETEGYKLKDITC